MRLDREVLNLDLYALLGAAPTASDHELRRAYRRKARASHPDLNPADQSAARRMAQVNLAARVLLDRDRRRAYDRARGIGSPLPSPPAHRRDESLEWEPAPRPRPGRMTKDVRSFLTRIRHAPGRTAEKVWSTLEGWPPQRHGAVLIVALLLTIGLVAHAKPRSLSFWCSPDCPPQPVSARKL
ncbi:MAG: DnaJ domain-containing protein [Polyangiaceae bacterium]